MSTYALEIRSTANWDDVRYRAYTTSERKANEFKARVKRIDFTDSGHGLIPVVTPDAKRTQPVGGVLSEHVRDCLRGEA